MKQVYCKPNWRLVSLGPQETMRTVAKRSGRRFRREMEARRRGHHDCPGVAYYWPEPRALRRVTRQDLETAPADQGK